MRAESLGLRSWWLLGGLLWALVVWAATLAGLGGAIAPLTAADTEAAALPALPATTTADTDAGAQYPEIAARPLFAEDRRPHPFVLGRDPAGAAGSARLTGVLITPGLEMATLTTDQGQSLRLRLGAEPESGWQLLALQPRSATVSGPHGTQTLELAVFDGNGGQAPTALLNVGPGDRPPSAAMPTPAPAVVPSPPVPPPPAAEINTPSAEQIQSLRERIQARRRLLQQNPNGQSPDQSK